MVRERAKTKQRQRGRGRRRKERKKDLLANLKYLGLGQHLVNEALSGARHG